MLRVPPRMPERGVMGLDEFRRWKRDISRLYPGRFTKWRARRRRALTERELQGLPPTPEGMNE